MEDFQTKDGKPITNDFTGYLIPGALDLPDTVSIPFQGHEATGPFGLKGVGEVAMNGPLPAVANAVHDACGVRVFMGPITPEKVLAAMERTDHNAYSI